MTRYYYKSTDKGRRTRDGFQWQVVGKRTEVTTPYAAFGETLDCCGENRLHVARWLDVALNFYINEVYIVGVEDSDVLGYDGDKVAVSAATLVRRIPKSVWESMIDEYYAKWRAMDDEHYAKCQAMHEEYNTKRQAMDEEYYAKRQVDEEYSAKWWAMYEEYRTKGQPSNDEYSAMRQALRIAVNRAVSSWASLELEDS